MKTNRLASRRTESGHHQFQLAGHTYIAAHVRSDYGDLQWIVDRDDQCTWAQCDTLAEVRATILAHG